MDAVAAAAAAFAPKVPGHYDKVYKTECVLTFDTPESDGGLYVNLRSWNGFGAGVVQGDHARTGDRLYLHMKWRRVAVEKPEMVDEAKETAKPTKVAIGVEGGFDAEEGKWEYEKEHAVVVFPEGVRVPADSEDLPEAVRASVTAVLAHDDASKEAEAAVWEQTYEVSTHALELEQLPAEKKISPDPSTWKCELCDKRDNLWLNLSTGQIGCGRKTWDGTGGNGHALEQYEAGGSRHPLAVKLGTITPAGADVFSYAPEENDMVLDPMLQKHLLHWGIDMVAMQKTERTMAEMEVDLNLTFEFDAIEEKGTKLEPVAGPGLIGLANLGNSCYMNSVLQALLSLPEVAAELLRVSALVLECPGERPAEDLRVQLAKLAQGVLTAAHVPATAEGESVPDSAAFVRPRMLKAVVGRGHPAFASNQQQDALEFLTHFLTLTERAAHAAGNPAENLSSLFEHDLEARLECKQSGAVRYRTSGTSILSLPVPLDLSTNAAEVAAAEAAAAEAAAKAAAEAAAVPAAAEGADPSAKRARTAGAAKPAEVPKVLHTVPFEACVQEWARGSDIDQFRSPATGELGPAHSQHRFQTFPRYLAVQVQRYVMGENWAPVKLDARVLVPDALDLSALRAQGRQASEPEMPDGDAAAGQAAAAAPVADDALVEQLAAMGFAVNGCKRACLAVSNAGVEPAMNWILQHMEDADFNDPLPAAGDAAPASSGSEPAAELVDQVCGLGFTPHQAKYALGKCDNSIERAVDWLFSHGGEVPAEGSEPTPAESGAAAPAKEDGEGKYRLAAVISHIGKNTGSGHYVCHVKKNGRWIIFNDRKVAISQNPPVDLGYIYIFRRADAPAVSSPELEGVATVV